MKTDDIEVGDWVGVATRTNHKVAAIRTPDGQPPYILTACGLTVPTWQVRPVNFWGVRVCGRCHRGGG